VLQAGITASNNGTQDQQSPVNYSKQVRDFVVTNFLFGEAGSLQEDTSFLDTGVVDSTGMLELIMFIESTWDIKVEPQEMVPENLDSINKIDRFLAKKLGSGASPAA
jgi:acyl carrier protein